MNAYIAQNARTREIFGVFATHKAAIEYIGTRERDKNDASVKIYPIQGMPEPLDQLATELQMIKQHLRNGVEL